MLDIPDMLHCLCICLHADGVWLRRLNNVAAAEAWHPAPHFRCGDHDLCLQDGDHLAVLCQAYLMALT